METRANYVLIGLFTLAVILGGFGFVYWFNTIGAGEFDELIRTLQRTLGLTVFMVTHDLDSLHTVCDRVAVLADGRVITAGPIPTMLASEHPWVKSYFRGKRSRVDGARAA